MAKTPKRATGNGDLQEVERLNVDYIKSNHFRTLAPSGLISSLTPQGQVQVALYGERQAIPQRVVYKLLPDGGLGEILEQVGRDAVVREVEIAVTMDKVLARALARRLLELVKELEADEQEGEEK